jgi:hypothetical protein
LKYTKGKIRKQELYPDRNPLQNPVTGNFDLTKTLNLLFLNPSGGWSAADLRLMNRRKTIQTEEKTAREPQAQEKVSWPVQNIMHSLILMDS